MTEQLSPATSKRYTLSQICRFWGLARSSFYDAFKARYNTTWLVAQHHYLTPSEARAQLTSSPYSSEPPSRAS